MTRPAAPLLSRRRAMTLIAITAVGGALVSQRVFAQATGGSTAALLPGADVCVLVPEVTEGPYYFDPALVRADITEGKPGAPLTVRMQVVDSTCTPIEGARVDIWHCDATGLYSGYTNQADTGPVDTQGQTFLRGTLFADASGVVEFASIYPGWYRGRTAHIHFKVFLDETNVLTGQIFFPEDLNDYVYANIAPYAERGADRNVMNANDGIAQQAGAASVATMAGDETQYLATLIVGVDPTALSGGNAGGFGGAPGRAGGPPPRA